MSSTLRIALSLLGLSITASACIEGHQDAALGTASFVSGAPLANPDYQMVVTTAGAQAVGTGGITAEPPPTAGMSGAMAGIGGAAGSAGVNGAAGMTGGAGGMEISPTAGTGGASGAAGESSTGGVGGSAGASGAAGAGGTAGGGTPTSTPGTLTLSFMSADLRGRYSPKNIGAVWVETSSGQFVKTLERWAATRARYLTSWNQAAPNWSVFLGLNAPPDELDAITRATLNRHEMHMLTWDMQDPAGAVVPDGSYKIKIEVTDKDATGAIGEIPFDKGAAPQTVTQSGASFTNATLEYTP